ncbi:hypothetical protein ES707_16344 [subsurface metagenome]
MKRFLILGSLILPIVILVACGQTSRVQTAGLEEIKVNGGSYWNITPAQLDSMLENKDFLLVNVHIPYEGEIPQTDLFVPYNKVEQNLSQFPKGKGAKIVLYCRSGSMSAIAARTLVKLGFTNVWNLDGGMVEWEKQGYDLADSEQH